MNARLPILLLLSATAILADDKPAAPAQPVVFAVSQVERAKDPLKTRPAIEALRQADGDEFEAACELPGQQWLLPSTKLRHPFLAAAHLAFADHRPLALSPDMVWLLLNQLAAAEVLAKPEAYRDLFAEHEQGKQTLSVRRDEFISGGSQNDWQGVFAEFESAIVKQVPESPAAGFSHAFSTSTSIEIAARRVTLLKAASPYYYFHVSTMCGIPEIALHGSVDDWRWIRQHAEDFRKLGMKRRVEALIPVLDQFVETAAGKPDAAFWRSFYKYESESGNSYLSGWINLFFLSEGDKALDLVLAKNFNWTNAPIVDGRDGAPNLPLAKTTRSYVANGMEEVEFTWNYLGETRPMRLRAGFMGVSQDPKTFTLRPQIAWQVLRQKVSEEERTALNYLGSIQKLGVVETSAIKQDFVFDPKTGGISVKKLSRSDTINHEFWQKALPLMGNLKTVDLGTLFFALNADHDQDAQLSYCKALCSAPAVESVTIPSDLDAECIKVLNDRKDWELKTK